MTTETSLVQGQPGEGLIITPAKKLIVEGLRSTFTNLYPNERLASMNINIEYPYEREHYPGIWVRFVPSVVRASGLNPDVHTPTEIYAVWHFEGTFSLTILALTSKERDLIVDGLIEAYAFAHMMPSASVLYSTITASDLINMTLQSDTLTPGGPTESVGTPWDDDKLVYEDRYSFFAIGQVRSRTQPDVVFTNLSEIETFHTLANVDGAPDNSIDDDGNGTWQ